MYKNINETLGDGAFSSNEILAETESFVVNQMIGFLTTFAHRACVTASNSSSELKMMNKTQS